MQVTPNERAAWNACVARSSHADVLQCWEWGELKARTAWQPIYVGVRRGSDLVATALLLKRSIPHTRRCLLYCPRGPVFDAAQPETFWELMAAVRDTARQHRAVALKADPALTSDSNALRLLREAGFRTPSAPASAFGGVQPRAVMKVDLRRDEDELLHSFHPKWRYNIRLAERKGVTVRSNCTREDIECFYNLLKVTARRDSFGIRALSYYYDLWDLILTPGLGRMFLAEVGGTAVSGAIVFLLGRQCWYVYGASDNEHRSLMPNHLMQWEMMRWARQQGCEVYDMRGVSPEVKGEPVETHLAGLNRFKRGFGAQYVEYVGDLDLVFSGMWYGLMQRALVMTRKRRVMGDE